MRLGCLPSELGGRITAAEFAEAEAYLREEPLDPALLGALAEMLAAAANGPLSRKDKRQWKAADFLPERWKPEAQAPAEHAPASAVDFVAGLRAQRTPVRRR